MSDKMRCEWGDCENIATHEAVFTSPSETVSYCRDCLPEVRAKLDYDRLDKL
jgi:hypothetical protein